MRHERITIRADQMGGVPCIRGLRIPVVTIVGQLANGITEREILANHPSLEAEDIRAALQYAAEALQHREVRFAELDKALAELRTELAEIRQLITTHPPTAR